MPGPVILIAGGAGYIGSHVNKMLSQRGYQTVVLDNLSKGHEKAVIQGQLIKGDLADLHLLDHIFNSHAILAVMHFAALIDVGESVVNPGEYYRNNVANTLNLLMAMQRHGVKTFIFSSTAAVYGLPIQIPISEQHPCQPINPYGESKWMVEKMLNSFALSNGLKFCALRYFNAAGGDPQGLIKNYKTKESNLIPLALRSLLNQGSITLFGTDYATQDGTCVRDYVHIDDLGAAHIAAMERLLQGGESGIFNLGNGQGFSVREVFKSVEKVTGRSLNVIEGTRRPGDPPFLVADASKAQQELHWHPRYASIDIMIKHAWQALNP